MYRGKRKLQLHAGVALASTRPSLSVARSGIPVPENPALEVPEGGKTAYCRTQSG